MFRKDLPDLLAPGAIAVELGVAEGCFSAELLAHRNIRHLYSIDAWAGDRRHDNREYVRATKSLSRFGGRSTVMRMRFAKALQAFSDGGLHLVYVDGYAHTGEDDGRIIRDWWPKVAQGGVLAGHDYCQKWPRVVAEVDRFAADNRLDVTVIPADAASGYPSWYVVKEGR